MRLLSDPSVGVAAANEPPSPVRANSDKPVAPAGALNADIAENDASSAVADPISTNNILGLCLLFYFFSHYFLFFENLSLFFTN